MTPERYRLKKAVRWMAIAALSLAGLVFLLLFSLTLPPGARLAKGILESQLQASLYQKVSIGELETNLLSRLVLTDIRIHDRSDSSTQSVIGVQRVAVQYDPWRLLHREFKILSLIIDSVAVSVTRDAPDRSNLAVLDSLDVLLADTTALPVTITIDTLAVNGVDLSFHDTAAGILATVKDAGIHLATNQAGDLRYYLEVPNAVVVYGSIAPPPVSFACSGAWRAEQLIAGKINLSSAGMTLQGQAGYNLSDSAIDLQLEIAGNPDSLANSVGAAFSVPRIAADGDLRCIVRAEGTVAHPSVRLALDCPPIRTDAMQTGNARLLASWENDTLFVDSCMIRVFGGSINAWGRMAADTTLWSDVGVRVSSLRLLTLSHLAPETAMPIDGQLDGDIAITGIVTEPATLDMTSHWQVRDLRYEDRSYPGIVADLNINGGRADVRIDGAGVNVAAGGRVQGDQVSGQYRVAIPDLSTVSRLAGMDGVRGTLTIDGSLAGTQSRPALRATLIGNRIQYQNLPLDSLHAQVRFADDTLYVEKLTFAGDWNGSDSADTVLGLPDVRGAINYTGAMSGPLMGINGGINVQMRDFGAGGAPRVSGRTSVKVSHGRTATIESRLAADSLKLEIQARYDLVDSTASMSLAIQPVSSGGEINAQPTGVPPLGWLTVDAQHIGSDNLAARFEAEVEPLKPLIRRWLDTLEVDGRLAITGSLSGGLETPRVDCDLALRQVRYEDWSIDSLVARVAMNDGTVRIDSLALYAPGARAFASLDVPILLDSLRGYVIDMDRESSGSIRVDPFDLATAGPMLPPEAVLSGIIEADMEWSGPLNSPTTDGWLTVTDVNFVRDPSSPPVRDVQGRILFSDSLVTLDTLHGELRGFPFTVSGWFIFQDAEHMRWDMGCDLAQLGTGHAQGSLSNDVLNVTARTQALRLATLSPFVPAVQELRGSMDTEVRVYGSLESPRVDGRLTVSDLTLCHPQLDSCLSEGRVVVSFTGARTRLDTLLIRYGTGWIEGSGYVLHPNVTPAEFDLTVAARDLRYDRPKFAKVVVDSMALRFRRTGDASILSGHVAMGDSRVFARIKPQSLAPWARTVERAGPSLPPMLENTRLDCRLDHADSLWIDNNIARIRLSAALAATGTVARPVVAGRVGIEEGYLLYLDRRFAVQEGVLLFADPEKINPDIVLRADTRITSYSGMIATPYVITLAVDGTPEELTVDMYADPPADYADIISLLTVGATRTELSGGGANGESGTKDVLLARGGELATQRVAGFMTKRVGNQLGLEEVSVEGNLFSSDRRADARLLATRRLSERLKLTYSTAVGHLNDQAVRLNYRLTRRFSLEGQTTQQGKSLLGIEYSLPVK